MIAREVARVLGVTPRLFGVAFHRLARFLARTVQPAIRAITGVVAQVGGAVSQAVSAVAHAARNVVEPMTQGLGVEPAARIDPLADSLVARRAGTLVQQQDRDAHARQDGDHASGDPGVFADLVHGVELSNHGHSTSSCRNTVVRQERTAPKEVPM
ncbi:hypothetical protein D3C80_1087520 [compost metagenome]